ncbi:TPR and ankyrin repeat-containing protein 1-like [Montipora capricornis]|uniref:TPR and ankyrin repeat-containing protein 1-like n=1 Tax=Montipora capricornis TaxID=246305 RepID=UPI0035F1F323
MDPDHAAWMGQMAMTRGDFPNAMNFLSIALEYDFAVPQLCIPLLVQRAECFWQLGKFQASVNDMEEAIRRGLPSKGNHSQREMWNWTNHGFSLYRNRDFRLAEQCVNIAFYFRSFGFERATTILCRGLIRYELNKESGAQRDIDEVKKMDPILAEREAVKQKQKAFEEFKQRRYEKSLRLFRLALMLHPTGSSNWVKFKRSNKSNQATAYFKLQKYVEALEIGEQSYMSDKTMNADEGKRWKERGNELSKDSSAMDLAIRCYSLALNYTPQGEKELKATIFSKRSLMYTKKEKDKEALQDATRCVECNPNWAKAHYLLGSCLSNTEQLSKAMKSFSRSLELLLEDSRSKEHRKQETFHQLLSVAMRQSGGTTSIHYTIPQNLSQTMIDKAVTEKDWSRLHLLFMGGGGEMHFEKGRGGLGTGCDASSVPLEEVVSGDFPNLEQFIRILLDHNAVASQRALDAAIELAKSEVVDVLMERKVKSTEASKSARQRSFKAEGQEALLKGEKRKASHLFELSLKLEDKTGAEKQETLEILCELYFEQKAFSKCLDTGYKLKAIYQENEKEIKQASLWKSRGNQLHKANEYELMAKYCSLAMEFTSSSDSETLTALLSNRCVAFINLKQWEEALADAEKCTTIRPQWFKGYSHHATCLFHLERSDEALGSFCKAHTLASSDKQKHSTAINVVLTAMDIPGGEAQITCTFSPSVLLHLVKEATEKNEWKKLQFLYLGSKSNKSSRGIAFECDASFVPLDLLIASDIDDLDELVKHLLLREAPPDGLRDCKRPPLLVAMEVMKFNLAVTLLRNNADPSCIVGNEIFINKEGQPKQWYHLGRKALDKNDHKKAVMLLSMCLHLPHDHTETIFVQAYHSLAEAHFKLNEHEKAIAAGKECYKLHSVKSEEKAKRWQMRASDLFEKGFHSICKECVNLAVMYTTNDLSLSLLLCQRSKVENQLGNYADGLEDAKKATKMTPALLEGYLCQVKCLRHLERPSETMTAINECIRRTTAEELIRDLLSDALDTAMTLDEGTSALTAPFPSHLLKEVTNKVIERKDWDKLRVLYIGGGGPSTQVLGRGGLATNIDASSVPLGEVIHHFHSKQPLLMFALLENGASANKIEGSQIIPLEEALKTEDLPLVEKLVQMGGNCCVASHDGDPIIHKSLKKGLENGNLRFLEAMLGSNIPGFQSVRDSAGNTLYHLVCTGKPTKHRRDAIRILQGANVNPHFRNKKGKRAIDILRRKDPRRKIISAAMSSIKSEAPHLISPRTDSENASAKQEKSQVVTPAKTENDEWSVSSGDNKEHKSREGGVSKIHEKQQWRIEMRENVARLIETLSKYVLFPPLNTLDEQESNEALEGKYVSADMIREHENETMNNSYNNNKEVFTGSLEHKDTRRDVIDDESIEEEPTYDKREAEIDFNSPFENLSWEVDCTDDVWKIMRSKKVGNNLRKRIVDKIRMLANGRWSTENLCKRLEGQAKREGIQLYETKLTKSQRIIWEKTVAFSNRLSDSPEHRLNAENAGGRIYCDIIRVWDIVLDHDKLQRSIERIIKSINRGMDCLTKTKLKGSPMDNAASSSNLCLPNKYTEVEEGNQASKLERKKKEAQKTIIGQDLSTIFYPPASANDQDYHILKFYSFNTPLVKSVLESDSSTKIDFPFKITELEYAIVNLQPDPATPIILLGRSGTGKTTCSLYRLWGHFRRYWEKALTAGPYIPKYLVQEEAICQEEEEEQQQQQQEKEEEETRKKSIQQGTCSKDPPSASNTSLGQDNDVWNASAAASEVRDDSEESHLQKRTSYPHIPVEEIQFEEQSLQDTSSTNLEHLHQVFITKNTVLCREVEKNFKELCHACPAETPRVNYEGRSIPCRIQDIHEEEWPFFVNSRDWLLLLDASLPGEPFFRRAPDGSLIRKIEGWGEEDNPLQLIPSLETDEESGDEEGEESTENVRDDEVRTKRTGDQKRERDPRREITYQVFKSEIWPQMIKSSKIDYHPTLVWTEIRSFIKGSAEALLGDKGVLTENDYMLLGKKKASNFTADRDVVYKLFQTYQRVRISKGMFDEADLVFNIHQRLQGIPAPEWSVHEIYVDETQDFTQAELSLLIRCCRSPNEMFFTGDTAQSIMRGIAFRFDDLKTLFHHAKEAAAKKDVRLKLRVPKKLYQLTYNYRSHAGILHLASSVVDLLLYFFPESFDHLKRDEGLFHGPKPVLLESCSPTDLALLLQGNQRQSSRIEFGAHQVVLVVSNEARKAMPEELKQALVLTIYEAKGLEFDDVLIYNFFKDSQARKEWRVVTSYLENQSKANVLAPTGLAEITEDEVAVHHTRPLKFDPEKHKVLNSEFKYLYTAITRARVNVWFFDEDEDARAPVFEYFRRLELVKVVSLSEDEEGTELPRMFATKSTPEEWQKGGHRFYKKGLWELAMQCFSRAGDKSMLEKCKARIQAAEAITFRYTSKERMRDEFLKASESFLKCGMPEEAGICLNNSREFILLAKLYEKMPGKLQEAARLFKKKGFPIDSSRCYESLNNYRDAIETLCRADHFDKALKVLERFNILSSISGPESLQEVIPPKSTRTAERLYHLLADKHFNRGNREEMYEVLQHLPSADRITFLKKRGCIREAAKTMEKEGKREEAAQFLRDMGRFQEAMEYSNDPKFSADCLMSLARTSKVAHTDVSQLLQRAQENYRACDDINGQAEVFLFHGKLFKDAQKLQEARRLFDKCQNCCGEVESVTELLKSTNYSPPERFSQWIVVRSLERLLRLVNLLYKRPFQLTNEERYEVERCEKHFGIFTTGVAHSKVYFNECGGRFSKVDPEFVKKNVSKTEATIDSANARLKVARFLIENCVSLKQMIRKMLEKTFSRNSVCRKVTDGKPCCCEFEHEDSKYLFDKRFHSTFNFVYLESVIQRGISEISSNKGVKDGCDLNDESIEEFHACQHFYDFLFPLSGCREHHLPNVSSIRKTKAVRNRLAQFAYHLWTKTVNRLSDTNNFLKVSCLLHLTDSSPNMIRLICKEEDAFEKMTKTLEDFKVPLAKSGMVRSKEGSSVYESYLHWWEDGLKRLYVHGDVKNAAHLIIRRFLTLTAKRRRFMIFPSIANTVMILEHQMTACLALYARLCLEHRYPVCLPRSYLTMVKFWDSFIPGVDKGTLTLYQAVDENARQEPNKERLKYAIISILNYLVKLTCGEVHSSFDVIGDALSLNNSTVEEAERTLVLFLTMLCNCGKGIPISVEEVLLRKLLTLDPNSSLPSHLKPVLKSTQEAEGYSDVVKILQSWLLKNRGEELLDLSWNWSKGKLWFHGPSNPSDYPSNFSIDVCILRKELEQSDLRVQEVDSHLQETSFEGENQDGPEESMEGELTAEERRERDEARSNISDMEEVETLTTQRVRAQVSVEEQNSSSRDILEEHFSRFSIDKTACGICGTTFKARMDDHPLPNQEDNKDNLEERSPLFQAELVNSEAVAETAETHQRSDVHLEKEKEFQSFRNLYVAEIYPYLMQLGDDLFAERKQMEDVTLDFERLERCRDSLLSEVEKIESTRRWTATALLLEAVKEFKAELEKTEQAKSDSVAQVHEDYEETEESLDENEEDPDEIRLEDVNQMKKKNRGKKRGKHRKQ